MPNEAESLRGSSYDTLVLTPQALHGSSSDTLALTPQALHGELGSWLMTPTFSERELEASTSDPFQLRRATLPPFQLRRAAALKALLATQEETEEEQPVEAQEVVRAACEPLFAPMLASMQAAVARKHGAAALAATAAEEASLREAYSAFFERMVHAAEAMGSEQQKGSASSAASVHADHDPGAPAEPHPSTGARPDSTQSDDQDVTLAGPQAKNSSVCCHWKNKGFCKFGNTCRFAHPEHKKGAGRVTPAPSAGAAAPRRRGRASTWPEGGPLVS